MNTCWFHVNTHLGCHWHGPRVLDLFGCPLRPEHRLRAETIRGWTCHQISLKAKMIHFVSAKTCMTYLDKLFDQNNTLSEYEDRHDTPAQVQKTGHVLYS